MNAVEEANVAFNMMMEIRNKVMDAYQEILPDAAVNKGARNGFTHKIKGVRTYVRVFKHSYRN